MGKKVNQTELAEIVGVTDVTIWNWQKEGMPVEERNLRGQSNVYDTAEVVAWMVARAEKRVREESPRDMLHRAQTKLAEIQIAEKTRQLVSAAEVEAEYARLVLASRQRLQQLRAELRHEIGAMSGGQDLLARVDDGFDAALRELSNYDPSAGGDPEGGRQVGAAVAENSGPVGGGEATPQ